MVYETVRWFSKSTLMTESHVKVIHSKHGCFDLKGILKLKDFKILNLNRLIISAKYHVSYKLWNYGVWREQKIGNVIADLKGRLSLKIRWEVIIRQSKEDQKKLTNPNTKDSFISTLISPFQWALKKKSKTLEGQYLRRSLSWFISTPHKISWWSI